MSIFMSNYMVMIQLRPELILLLHVHYQLLLQMCIDRYLGHHNRQHFISATFASPAML
jgi:hypothetical protein